MQLMSVDIAYQRICDTPADFFGSHSISAHSAYCRNTAYSLAGDTDTHNNAKKL